MSGCLLKDATVAPSHGAKIDVITRQRSRTSTAMSARAGAHRFVEPVDFPLVVVGRCVLLILVVDRVLFRPPSALGAEIAADGFFLGALGFAWGGTIRRRLLLVTPAQVITQLIRRSICLRSGAWRCLCG